MPTQQEQIDWLIRQVNDINDQGCGCEDCSGGGLPFVPRMKTSFGLTHTDDTATTPFVRQGQLDDLLDATTHTINSQMLIIDLLNFEEIQQYSPVLLIDRFRPRKKVRAGYRRKSGYKHETLVQANDNGRVNEIPLTAVRNVVDIKPEGYFVIDDSRTFPKGLSKRYTFEDELQEIKGCFTTISLRLRFTIDGQIIETNSLQKLKVKLLGAEGKYDIQYQFI